MTLIITHGSLSCQLTAVRPLRSLGADISETAQPYQKQAPTAVGHPAPESGNPERDVSSKETSYVPYPHAVTMDPGLASKTHRRWPAPTGYLICGE